jgi:oxygen-independent coproporphyrinogen-3 oxidase
LATPDAPDFGLYIHWPYCQAKCPYCDFNSHVAHHIDHARWLAAYRSEIARIAEETGPRTLRSIFFGGGTPSLMQAETVAGIIDAARAAWTWANDVEITLEANPTSSEAARFRAFRDAGVNRVSIGVQALNDADLTQLGRLHSAAEARAAFDLARGTFPRVSFDLIYARQNQTLEAWRTELREALSFAADHLSLYQLTIEPGTAFGDRHGRGLLRGLPDDDRAADMYELTQDMCAAADLPAYEVSNHAVAEAQSRHNLIYWRSQDWAGIGPGAHARLTLGHDRWAIASEANPVSWLSKLETEGHGESSRDRLSVTDQAEEILMMGLRLAEGVDMRRLDRLGAARPAQDRIESLSDLGLLDVDDDTLRATQAGRQVLNAVLRDLLA